MEFRNLKNINTAIPSAAIKTVCINDHFPGRDPAQGMSRLSGFLARFESFERFGRFGRFFFGKTTQPAQILRKKPLISCGDF